MNSLNSLRQFSAFFLLVLLLVSNEMGVKVVEGVCWTKSLKFKGRCNSSTNCAHICLFEQYKGGKCRGLISPKCYCYKDCSSSPALPTPPGPESSISNS
ncbi:hypothetical protein M5689_002793 [Euphorbia peplus]|nr:hypothetical protein M5689_002793 [Euphorbia peplus]